jgi:hypothetical protein
LFFNLKFLFIFLFEGYLTACGSAARILGPIWATNALRLGKNEGEIVFLITSAILFFALLLLFIFRKRLIPHPLHSSNGSSELSLYIRNTILFDEDDTDDVNLEEI